MARNGYRTGGEEGNHENNGDAEKMSDDMEFGRQSRRSVGYRGKDEPFGDETKSEVKYRTMAWWYVELA